MNKPIEAKNGLQKALRVKQQLPREVTSDNNEDETLHLIGGCLIEMNKLADVEDHFEKAIKVKPQR